MASYEKRGKKTRVVISVMDKGVRKKVSKTFNKKSDAKDWAMRMEIDKADNRQIIASQMLFSDYFEEWYLKYKANDVRKTSLLNYKTAKNNVAKLFANVKLTSLTYSMLQSRFDEYGKTHQKQTVSLLISKIKSSLKDALFDGLISKDFFSRLKAHGIVTKKNNFLSATDFEKLQSYLYDHWQDSSYHLATLIGLETGMRIGEVLMISKKEVFPKFNTIFVQKSYSPADPDDERTKNAPSVRKIKIPERLSAIMKVTLKNQKGRIFTMTELSLETNEKKILKSLNIKEITFHGLRHSHISYLLYKGLSLEYVANRAGHVDTTTTQKVYAHLLKEQKAIEDKKTMDLLGKSPNVPTNSGKARYDKA